MRRYVVLAVLALAFVLCASQSFADRLVLMPTGSVLDRGEIRAEAAFYFEGGGQSSGTDVDVRRYWVNVGLGQVEVEASRREMEGGFKEDLVSAQAAIMPETILTPAVSAGVLDITNEIERGYYVAVTKTVPLTDQIPLFLRDIKVHAGYGIKGINGIFGGAQVGLPMGLTLAAEHDGDDINASLSWNALPMVGLKIYSLDSELFYGASFRTNF